MSKRVAIITDYFLHPENDDFLAVAENQTLWQLIGFLRGELGLTVDLFQVSPLKERWFRGVRILGLATKADYFGMFPGLNTKFAQHGLDYDLQIYYHWHLAYPCLIQPAIVISHGIFWDTPAAANNRLNPVEKAEWLKRMEYGLTAARKFVFADRNTANVVKALWPGYEHRLHYLPPGIDLACFQPRPKEKQNAAEAVRIICPQDFTEEQGVHTILQLAKALEEPSEGLPPIEFHLVGSMSEFENSLVLASLVRQQPNCRFYWTPLAKMPEVYREADIALLPSQAAEGASLYGLQALASGLPLIIGMAGGLSELVVDGWNGRIVKPDLTHLQAAVSSLIQNSDLCQKMSENSRRLAEGYSLESWEEGWGHLIEELLEKK